MRITTRDAMFEKYHYLVFAIARKMKRGLAFRVDVDDLCADGAIGLLDAIARFDKSKGVPFSSYAGFRVRGEIIDGLRKRNWMSRTVQTNINKMERATQELGHELKRPPHRDETARRMKVSLEKLGEIEARSLAQTSPESLQGLASEVVMDITPSNIPAPEDRIVFKDLVDGCVSLLNGRQKSIWRLRYLGGLTIREIADIHGLSESRVCQLLKRMGEQVRLPA